MDHTALLGLLGTAAFLGFFHTVTGPDHYIPFIAMGKVGRWSFAKTLAVSAACGVGHVASSIVLGFVGIALSIAVTGLEWFEGVRGDLAAWLLLGFGLAYMVWGIRRAIRNRPHAHLHAHADGSVHWHVHTHHAEHAHPHAASAAEPPRDPAGPRASPPACSTGGSTLTGPRASPSASSPACSTAGSTPTHGVTARMTPWVLFTIFIFGPCEPLIPILMYPALKLNLWAVALVAGVFAVCTIGTMLAVVALGYYGVLRLATPRLERYAHAIAGGSLAVCGLLMILGL
ncbi:MAG: hypothetical protein AB1716_06815 [Planctomycetota bacterium]